MVRNAFLIGLLSPWLFLAAQAAVITVNGTGDGSLADLAGNGTCDLREAIKAANENVPVGGCPPGDGGVGEPELILFDLEALPATILLDGSLIIFRDLIIRGPGPEHLTIEPLFANSDAAFITTAFGAPSPDVVISGLRIANFYDRIGGGAIRGRHLDLSDMEFVGNSSFWGAGALSGGFVRAERVVFIDNSSSFGAGALECQDCEIIDAVFRGNLTADRCEAIDAYRVMLNRVEVTGSIRVDEAFEDASAVCIGSGEILNSTIAMNDGPIGVDAACDVRIAFSTIAFNAPSVATAKDVTVGVNRGGGGASNPECPIVEASILTGHDLDIRDDDGLDVSHSVVTTPGPLVLPPSNVAADPLLLPISQVASFTGYYPFAAGSPAMDLAVCSDPNMVDQRGEPRLPGGGSTCDAGSYEETGLINRIGFEDGIATTSP